MAFDVAGAVWGAASPRGFNHLLDLFYTSITLSILSQLWLQQHLCAWKGNKTTGWCTNGEIYLNGGPVEKQNDFDVGGIKGGWHRTRKLTKRDGKNGDLWELNNKKEAWGAHSTCCHCCWVKIESKILCHYESEIWIIALNFGWFSWKASKNLIGNWFFNWVVFTWQQCWFTCIHFKGTAGWVEYCSNSTDQLLPIVTLFHPP